MRNSRFVRCAALLVVMFVAAVARAEDLKVIQLEQNVRDLQLQVQQQSRRIDALESQLAQTRSAPISPQLSSARSKKPSTNTSSPWLTIENWDRIRAGFTELQVLEALGPPTAVRKTDDSRQTLLYSLEISAGGFLSGQVILDDHRVVEIQKPALK